MKTMPDETWKLIMTSDEFGVEEFEPYDSAALAWAAAARIANSPAAQQYPAERWFRVERVPDEEED